MGSSDSPRRKAALDYHAKGRPGKIEVVPTKPTANQYDLSLAYSPGVAEPCLEIQKRPEDAFKYTARGNLVGVITNGSAVLGLGNIGPLAAKPVMEGKGVLFKRFAGIDVFDIEVDAADPDEFIRVVSALEATFGGINLEDIKAPDCFKIEAALEEKMGIPVFHDDQHGTAIISAAALMNACSITGRKLEEIQVVFSGAGAAAIATARLFLTIGVEKEHLTLCDSKGVVHTGRDVNPQKAEFARDTADRTLTDALRDADVFVGVSAGGIVSGDMLAGMKKDPIVFALANPEPEIRPEAAREARADVIMATGRSDYANQVNNVLGFPYIFRGALDVRATHINQQMKMAAVQALADLAHEDVPDLVVKAYGGQRIEFGREYLIPKPLDPRLLLHVAPAVAQAACDSGVARESLPGGTVESYRESLERLLGRTREVMRPIINRAARDPKRLVFPEGTHPKIIRAAQILVDESIAAPILLGEEDTIRATAADLHIELDGIELIDPAQDQRRERFGAELLERRKHKGMTAAGASKKIVEPDYFGAMMVRLGHADGQLSGVSHAYPETIRPALQVVGLRDGHRRVFGLHVVLARNGVYFFADTTVNIDPSAADLAEIAIVTADAVKFFTDEQPRIAMISFSNFGSTPHAKSDRVCEAVGLVREKRPELCIDGEMRIDAALDPDFSKDAYPGNQVGGDANVLVFPDLDSGNHAYKLMATLGGAELIGPVLLGIDAPVNVIVRGSSVTEIVNLAAVTVVRAQE